MMYFYNMYVLSSVSVCCNASHVERTVLIVYADTHTHVNMVTNWIEDWL
jgi:hypothetical protein